MGLYLKKGIRSQESEISSFILKTFIPVYRLIPYSLLLIPSK